MDIVATAAELIGIEYEVVGEAVLPGREL